MRKPSRKFAADGHDHEFLEVDGIVGVHAAIDDVHLRHRQNARRRSADITIERQAPKLRGGLGDRERHAENRVGAQPAFVRRSVQLAHHAVDADLVFRLEAANRVEDLGVDGGNRLLDALAAIAFAAVAQLDGFVRTRRCAGRHSSAAERSLLQPDIDLHGRIAAAVQDFAGDHVDDCGHLMSST
jgi:hypothetical protein